MPKNHKEQAHTDNSNEKQRINHTTETRHTKKEKWIGIKRMGIPEDGESTRTEMNFYPKCLSKDEKGNGAGSKGHFIPFTDDSKEPAHMKDEITHTNNNEITYMKDGITHTNNDNPSHTNHETTHTNNNEVRCFYLEDTPEDQSPVTPMDTPHPEKNKNRRESGIVSLNDPYGQLYEKVMTNRTNPHLPLNTLMALDTFYKNGILCISPLIKVFIPQHRQCLLPTNSTFVQLLDIQTSLPAIHSIVALPDLHHGYCFPIGSVISLLNDTVVPEGIGSDINCGVRMVRCHVDHRNIDLPLIIEEIYDLLPVGMGNTSINTIVKELVEKINETRRNELKINELKMNETREEVKMNKTRGDSKMNKTRVEAKINETMGDSKHIHGISGITQNESGHDQLAMSGNYGPNRKPSTDTINSNEMDCSKTKGAHPRMKPLNDRMFLNGILDHGLKYLLELGIIPDYLDSVENNGYVPGDSRRVSQRAKSKGLNQLASLGAGNHFLEFQRVEKVYSQKLGIQEDELVFMIHTGSRGLGHTICDEMKEKKSRGHTICDEMKEKKSRGHAICEEMKEKKSSSSKNSPRSNRRSGAAPTRAMKDDSTCTNLENTMRKTPTNKIDSELESEVFTDLSFNEQACILHRKGISHTSNEQLVHSPEQPNQKFVNSNPAHHLEYKDIISSSQLMVDSSKAQQVNTENNQIGDDQSEKEQILSRDRYYKHVSGNTQRFKDNSKDTQNSEKTQNSQETRNEITNETQNDIPKATQNANLKEAQNANSKVTQNSKETRNYNSTGHKKPTNDYFYLNDTHSREDYLLQMGCAINYAYANRALIHLTVDKVLQKYGIKSEIVYDVGHNSLSSEWVDEKMVMVHRKGASRALPKGHGGLTGKYKDIGQPVPIGGSMGTASYLLLSRDTEKTNYSCPHGSGRILSRAAAKKQFTKQDVTESMGQIILKCKSDRGAIEEHPSVYKNIDHVADAATELGIAEKVVRCVPLAVIKG